MMTITDRDQFLEAMRYTAASVAVVTTEGPSGQAGVTVSAVCSLSAEPPSLLVCVHELSPALAHIRSNAQFCVNLLSSQQTHVADSFAGRIAQWRDNRFACAQWVHAPEKSPELVGALANVQCSLAQAVKQGTHWVLIGEVQAVVVAPQPGLLYVDRAYRCVGEAAVLKEDLYA